MIVAQITDLHIVDEGDLLWDGWDSASALKKAVARLNGLTPRPDFLIVTGDLIDTGEAEAYDHLKALLAPLTMPIGLIPGNHDGRDGLRTLGLGQAYDPSAAPFCQFATALGPLRLIGLDTLEEGAAHGTLCQQRLDWFEQRLAEDTATPTIVALHHPPFDSGIASMDGLGLKEGRAHFVQLVERAPNVVRILCGHQHRPIVTMVGGAVVSLCSSTTVQIPFDVGPKLPTPLRPEPPTLQLHLWQSGNLVSHALYIDEF